MNGPTLFIDELARLSPDLRAARDEAADYWAPEDVPSPVLLLALGHRLADDFGKPGMDTDSVFAAIEHAIADSDPQIAAAAERVIEAAVGRAGDRGTWPELRLLFRDRSAAHALTCMTLDR